MSRDATPAHPLPWPWNAVSRALNTLARLSPATAGAVAFRLFCTPRRVPLSGREQAFLRDAVHFTIPVGDVDLVAYAWGTGERNVLLVHGWESHAARMRAFVMPLVQAGYRVIAFDAPAHGASPGKQLSLPLFAEAIRAVVESVDSLDAIIAHSLGAAATIYLLATDPSLAVPRVVLSGPPAELSGLIDQFAAMLQLSRRVIAALEHRIEKRFDMPVAGFSLAAMAPHLRARGLVIHDRDDSVIPFREGAAIAGAWPGATLLATEGLGHRGVIRNPEVLRSVLSFLTAPDVSSGHLPGRAEVAA